MLGRVPGRSDRNGVGGGGGNGHAQGLSWWSLYRCALGHARSVISAHRMREDGGARAVAAKILSDLTDCVYWVSDYTANLANVHMVRQFNDSWKPNVVNV